MLAFAVALAVAAADPAPLAIVVHGGAGALEKGLYSPEEEAAFKAKLAEALDIGYATLERGGAAVDAVESAITVLEDSPLFNAGKGAVFTRAGKNELDAAIMNGADGSAGAVAGVERIKNPISLARAVMEKSPHVMMIGAGAEEFAAEQGIGFVDPSYFYTEKRWRALQDALKRETEKKRSEADAPHDFKYGTVGAVALDARGNLAAGTSTGGMTMKRFGRVGDAPVIGAGTYADNRSCAVSATGWGEHFIRLTVARDICAQMEYGGKRLDEAAYDVIHNRLQASGGDGGVIALAPGGEYVMTFNSKGMFRGVKTARETKVLIYAD